MWGIHLIDPDIHIEGGTITCSGNAGPPGTYHCTVASVATVENRMKTTIEYSNKAGNLLKRIEIEEPNQLRHFKPPFKRLAVVNLDGIRIQDSNGSTISMAGNGDNTGPSNVALAPQWAQQLEAPHQLAIQAPQLDAQQRAAQAQRYAAQVQQRAQKDTAKAQLDAAEAQRHAARIRQLGHQLTLRALRNAAEAQRHAARAIRRSRANRRRAAFYWNDY